MRFVNLWASLLLALFFAAPVESRSTPITSPGYSEPIQIIRSVGAGGIGMPPVGHSDSYLARQAAALRPAFRGDLERLADAPRYTIQASVDPESGSVSGEMRLDYTNTTGETLADLAFRLYPNAETIYGGGSLDVGRVAQGRTALRTDRSEDGTVLWARLQRPLEPGRRVQLALTFNAQVPAGTSQGYGIFNRALGVVALAGWYPVLAVYDGGWLTPPVPLTGDAMMAETGLYEVDLTVPEGYELVSTGTAIESHRSEKGVTWHVVSGPAREFAVALSDRFKVQEARVGEVTLRLYTLPADEPVVTDYAGLAVVTGAFETFVSRFGPYPFLEFDVVEASVPIDGYEFSGMVYVGYGVRTQESLDDYEYVVAHELAHQWWYGLVGNHTVDEPWLDEGLATYAAVLYKEDAYSPGAGERLLGYWQRMEGGRQPQDPPLNSSTLEFSSWGPYHKTVYTQAAFFLAQLRQELGEEAFFELLKRYQRTYRYRMGTTQDFLRLAERVAGRDLSPLFESWFDTEAAREGKLSQPGSKPNKFSPASLSPPPRAGPQEF
jgi:hypothetical protein